MADIARRLRPAVVFVGAACFLWWMLGNRLLLAADEGIYLDGATRMLHGSLPYRDFFVLTGPATFWNLAVLFKLFGIKLASARILLVADLSLLVACAYWLTNELSSASVALWLTGVYLALLFLTPEGLMVNHRWDSSAISTLAVCCFYQALKSGQSESFVAAGIAAAYAAWSTPNAILYLVIFLFWLVFFERSPLFVLALAVGVALVSVPAVAYLAVTHSFTPMLHHLLWTAANYSKANHVFYGYLMGGYSLLFAKSHGAQVVLMTYLAVPIILPAIAGPLAAVGYLFARRSLPRECGFLLLACATGVLTCYPRADIPHLQFVAIVPYVVAVAAFTRLLPHRLLLGIVGGLTFGTLLFLFSAIEQRIHLDARSSRVGILVGEQCDVKFARALEEAVSPGEVFFSFPYAPMAYFLTQGENPTRYSYLQPGMMTAQDEAVALSELQKAPPSRVLYSKIVPEQFLKVFPSSNPSELQLPRIDAWLAAHYDRTKPTPLMGAELLVRKPDPITAR